MIDVPVATQEAYLTDSIGKDLTLYFPDLKLTYTNSDFIAESMELKESILEKDSIEFVGCISSYFKIELLNANDKLKGQRLEVSIQDHASGETIKLFHGIVDSGKKTANKSTKTIEAYDDLYSLSNVDVTEWWNEHETTTQSKLLRELLRKYNLSPQYSFLVNGHMPAFCGTKRKVTQLSALDVLRQLCQASGGFGKINREGFFQVLYIGEKVIPPLLPSITLFPSDKIYPSEETQSIKVDIDPTKFNYYQEVNYEDFSVVPIQKVVLRDSEDDEETFYGDGRNKYIVQGNLFVFDQTKQDRIAIAKNIYLKTRGISYTPFTSKNNGLPFIECGDCVAYDEINLKTGAVTEKQFFVLTRNLKGIQSLKDSYEAEGLEYQNVFITDLQAKIEQAKAKSDSEYNKTTNEMTELKKRIARLEALIGNPKTITGLPLDMPVAEAMDSGFVSLHTIASQMEN